ncbi:helix-turn-helix domain-containing protein [Inquilinus sp. YAF38]|uniref:AlbA family DNA-binding domain-containing protein n=1 Tax=Inquilinus sp. YAF38 TaxID=3233084 RepID=UPI003F8F6A9E
MDTDELESLLDGAEETDRIEFKAAIDWNKNIFVKDILAMSNIQDGGRIIVGVADQTFARQGLSETQIATYAIDHMRDQIAPFADPLVIFTRHVVEDRNGLKYVVIDVSPFETIPVICRRDGADVHQGTIYFRSRARRPQSARISNYMELRDVIDTAVSRGMRRMRRMGFAAEQEPAYDYDAELGGL